MSGRPSRPRATRADGGTEGASDAIQTNASSRRSPRLAGHLHPRSSSSARDYLLARGDGKKVSFKQALASWAYSSLPLSSRYAPTSCSSSFRPPDTSARMASRGMVHANPSVAIDKEPHPVLATALAPSISSPSRLALAATCCAGRPVFGLGVGNRLGLYLLAPVKLGSRRARAPWLNTVRLKARVTGRSTSFPPPIALRPTAVPPHVAAPPAPQFTFLPSRARPVTRHRRAFVVRPAGRRLPASRTPSNVTHRMTAFRSDRKGAFAPPHSTRLIQRNMPPRAGTGCLVDVRHG